MTERLNRWLAHAGVTSRRGADRLIEQGRVKVNGVVVGELGTQISPERDAIRVDDKRIAPPPSGRIYLLLNKPSGCVTTLSDPEGRPCVGDLVRKLHRRVYPVGRLDFHSEGLLLLTDDGELARDLMHPGKGVAKTYSVKVRGRPSEESLGTLRRGVDLDGRQTLPAQIRVVRAGHNSWLEVTIREGRKHQVRRMLEKIGHPVQRLKRTRLDGLELGTLSSGNLRPLGANEVARLKRAVRSAAAPSAGRPRRSGRAR